MDNSEKPNIECQYRSTNLPIPAKCSKIPELFEISPDNSPILPISACNHCIIHKSFNNPTLFKEPFKSLYQKLIITKQIKPIYRNTDNLCNAKRPIENSISYINIEEYKTHVFDCRKFGKCTITPVKSFHSCQTCTHVIKTAHLYKHNPNYEKTYPTQIRYGQKAQNWAIAITSAPRIKPTIIRCYNSLIANGFDNILIFTEPGQNLDPNWNVIIRQEKLGIFRNFILSLMELYLRNTKADAFMIIQDDAVFSIGFKNYIETFLWPDENPHIITPWTCSSSKRESYGWWTKYQFAPVAFIMSNDTIKKVIENSKTMLDFWETKGLNDDFAIYHLAKNSNMKIYHPWPSLIDHIGTHSTHCGETLHEHVVWTTKIIAPQALNKVEHWFITDARGYKKNQIINMEKPLHSKWIVISSHEIDGIITTTDPIDHIKNHSDANWIILTTYPMDIKIISDIPYEILSRFDYQSKSINLGMGYLNNHLCYKNPGPCMAIYNLKSELTLHPHNVIEQLETVPLWRIEI